MKTLTKTLSVLLLLLVLFWGVSPIRSQSQPASERIAFSVYRNGQWDIYSITPDGSKLHQLTNDPFEDTDPAYAPDGSRLAFTSRRENNWDIYILDLHTGEQTRLTTSPHYDGAPTWRPDGQAIAYESSHAGDLDIWTVEMTEEAVAVNLTAEAVDLAGQPAGDFAPAWSPAGSAIAFTSWRQGNKDLFLLDIATNAAVQLTNSAAGEEWPAWSPDGDKLAFVVDDLGVREVYTLDLETPPADDGPLQPVTWLGRTDGPVWDPTGETIAAVYHRWDGDILMVNQTSPEAAHQLPQELTDIVTIQGRLTWHEGAVEFGQLMPTLINSDKSPLYEESVDLRDDPETAPYSLVHQNDLVVGAPWLADTVDDSFHAWRIRVRNEVGYDFLRELSDATRDIGSYTETSHYASWHKSGRAIDMLFDYYQNGRLFHELIREEYGGETFWRIMLRCQDQSGRCGRPITANAWNYSQRARAELAPDQGGVEKTNLTGYYTDLTAIGREYGWERISSYDDIDYNWAWHFVALEYWHYQKRLKNEGVAGATNWYEAMRHIYSEARLNEYFSWEEMLSRDEDPHLIALKGVPLPLERRAWWALVEQ